MQCSGVNELKAGDWAIVKERVPNCGERMINAQVVATAADKLTILPVGEYTPREIPRSAAESYQAVYGTAVPRAGANPIVVQDQR